MLKAYEILLRLYPADVRFAYGEEMRQDFAARRAAAAERGPLHRLMFVARQVISVLCDAAAERVNSLYSHRSFHGRSAPNPGVVRPPNVGKKEWFGGGDHQA